MPRSPITEYRAACDALRTELAWADWCVEQDEDQAHRWFATVGTTDLGAFHSELEALQAVAGAL